MNRLVDLEYDTAVRTRHCHRCERVIPAGTKHFTYEELDWHHLTQRNICLYCVPTLVNSSINKLKRIKKDVLKEKRSKAFRNAEFVHLMTKGKLK